MTAESAPSTRHIDVEASTAALLRAAASARKTAIATNTCLVVMQNYEVVRIPAEELRKQAQMDECPAPSQKVPGVLVQN